MFNAFVQHACRPRIRLAGEFNPAVAGCRSPQVSRVQGTADAPSSTAANILSIRPRDNNPQYHNRRLRFEIHRGWAMPCVLPLELGIHNRALMNIQAKWCAEGKWKAISEWRTNAPPSAKRNLLGLAHLSFARRKHAGTFRPSRVLPGTIETKGFGKAEQYIHVLESVAGLALH